MVLLCSLLNMDSIGRSIEERRTKKNFWLILKRSPAFLLFVNSLELELFM
jgi:hypothetical protein